MSTVLLLLHVTDEQLRLSKVSDYCSALKRDEILIHAKT